MGIGVIARRTQDLAGLELNRFANLLQLRLVLGCELKDEFVLKKIHGVHPKVVYFNDREDRAIQSENYFYQR